MTMQNHAKNLYSLVIIHLIAQLHLIPETEHRVSFELSFADPI